MPKPKHDYKVEMCKGVIKVEMQAEAAAPAAQVFGLLADIYKHKDIFRNLKGGGGRLEDIQLLEDTGSRRRYAFETKLPWRFLAFNGTIATKFMLEADLESRMVAVRLREPGFFKVYECIFNVLPPASPNVENSTGPCGMSDSPPPTQAVKECTATQLASPEQGCVVRVDRFLVATNLTVPKPFHGLLKRRMVHTVEGMLDDIISAASSLQV